MSLPLNRNKKERERVIQMMMKTRHGLAQFLYTITDEDGQQTIVLELVNE